jgi:hypothetical protein
MGLMDWVWLKKGKKVGTGRIQQTEPKKKKKKTDQSATIQRDCLVKK